MQLVARRGLLKLEGEKEQVDTSREVLNKLLEIVRSTGRLDLEDVEQAIVDAKSDAGEETTQVIDVFLKGIFIKPKTEGQAKYIEAIKKNDLVFCIGPAGTGKTYLAVAMALSFLKSGRIRRIVLARPAVEAGEKLGYLPGDIKAKVNPYLRPLYDAIADMMDVGHVKKYLESDIIEILPLAYMRGRTLNDSFIILDEAQNCTVKQMKTFLTRLGMRSRVVVTGDITQVDLPAGEMSGLIDVQERLMNIQNISFVYLTKSDIVRHKLVQDIVDAYEM
ncbi:phosphate starvation-induced protein [Candidatus Jettenia caeni]|uniref:PhoH-like protein n=1 Tax=Candidatus Jettenia caeni TaxID=247490 RepID=I3ILK5_9BACT|nr:phosphate starvation-induced protein [Candidatus Jettenia caeni]